MALLLVSVALAVALLFFEVYTGSGGVRTVAAQTTSKPNFVFILADDMRNDDLKYMPKTRSLLKDKGMSFSNAYVSNPLCCPSRATIMRGQYAHNTAVWANNGSKGGWKAYRTNGNEEANVATRLDNAGYRTALLGKYFNDYGGRAVPVGWDDWFAMVGQGKYFDYDVNDSGTIKHYGTHRTDYSTDVLSRQTKQFIGVSIERGKPFFAYVAPKAPHAVSTPATRDLHTYDGVRGPRPPSFNEKDVSDKPPWIRSLPRLAANSRAKIDNRHESRAETLQALDDLVERVVNKLRDSGRLGNTYIFFTSDNGWHHGEHRIQKGKKRPYEEDTRVPLLVRGPGVPAGSTTHKLALNTDFFPTFTDLAGLRTPGYVDGRSLRRIIKGLSTTWRSAILLEARHVAGQSTPVTYYGIRTSNGKKYVEYAGGFKEFYDMEADPYELRNRYKAGARPGGMAKRLQALKSCAGTGCRSAENGQ